MKTTILSTIAIAAAFSAAVAGAAGDFGSVPQAAAVQAPRVLEMAKTVVTAKRLPADAIRVVQAPRVVEMAKTVVTAKRLPADAMLVAQAPRVVQMAKTVVTARRLPADAMLLASAL